MTTPLTRFLSLPVALLLIATLAGWQSSPASPPQTPASRPAEETAMAYALIKTNHGDIHVELDRAKAPVSVENFLTYAADEYYDGTIFHRVIPTFMIQGGGFTADMKKKKTRDPITNEWRNGLSNELGTLAMARLGGQADSATSQFFINVGDNGFLDQPRDGAGYAVFGRVVAGLETVEAIKSVSTTNHGQMQNVPVEAVVIESIREISAEDAAKVVKESAKK